MTCTCSTKCWPLDCPSAGRTCFDDHRKAWVNYEAANAEVALDEITSERNSA